jgi:hypothetical protein
MEIKSIFNVLNFRHVVLNYVVSGINSTLMFWLKLVSISFIVCVHKVGEFFEK